MTLSENIEENIEEHIIFNTKRPRGRPINPDRHLPDGSYNEECLDPEYAKHIIINHSVLIILALFVEKN